MKKSVLFFVFGVFLLNLSQWSLAEDNKGTQRPQSTGEQKPLSQQVDEYHEKTGQFLLSSAEWIDSFFAGDDYVAEENKTYLRTRVDGFIEEGESFDANFRYKLRLRLPSTENKWALRVGSDEDLFDDQNETSTTFARDRLDEVEDDTSVALERFLLNQGNQNLKLSGGVRIRSGSVVPYASSRYRYTTTIDDWTIRFTERPRWYDDDGWESRTRLDFEHPLNEALFFRLTPGLDWYERKDGLYYSVTASVFQPLDESTGVQYELNNYFHTEVSGDHEETNVRIRFRKRIYKDWLIFEIAPQLAWYEERDYETVPGLFLRLESWFGNFSNKGIFDY